MDCLKFIVKGKAQGVFYRKYITKKMNEKKIVGFIKNLPDGDVEVLVKNKDNLNIKDILDILYEGSPKSEVKEVDMQMCQEKIDFKNSFEVRY
jgi:acylphosphatase